MLRSLPWATKAAFALVILALATGAYLTTNATRAAGGRYSYLTSADVDSLQVSLSRAAAITPTGKVREFNLVARPAKWELLPGVAADAFTYNGSVPGPTLRLTEGDTVKVTLKNELDKSTSIHWHGLHVPSAMDGVPGLTQQPIMPGESFTYEFVASHAGTFMYHPHVNSVEQIDRGLYGLLIIDPQKPDEPRFDREFTMMLGAWNLGGGMSSGAGRGGTGGMSGMGATSAMSMDYNYFTINGKAFPAVEPWTVRQGDKVRVRIVNISNLVHPMHLHGHDFKVVAKDGEPLSPANQQVINTLSVNAGETYDIVFVASNPGQWAFHCHELHHTENDGVEPGGLVQVIAYEGSTAVAPASQPQPAAQPSPTMPANMPDMRH